MDSEARIDKHSLSTTLFRELPRSERAACYKIISDNYKNYQDLGPNKTLKDLYSKLYSRLAESHAISEYTIIYSWAKAGLWPINPEAVTKRSMVKPEMNSTILGKRGRKMERGDVMIDGSTIVHHGRADKENVTPSNKKTRRNKAPKTQKLV